VTIVPLIVPYWPPGDCARATARRMPRDKSSKAPLTRELSVVTLSASSPSTEVAAAAGSDGVLGVDSCGAPRLHSCFTVADNVVLVAAAGVAGPCHTMGLALAAAAAGAVVKSEDMLPPND
jgi:hypothetical protein